MIDINGRTTGMKTINRILMAALAAALIVAAVFSLALTAGADNEKKDIQNVVLAEDGTLTWDPYEGAAQYWIRLGPVAFNPEGTSTNLFERAVGFHLLTGKHAFSIVACDENWADLSNYYYGEFDFVAPIGLDAPANPRWEGKTAVWDAVNGAIEYEVYVYRSEGGAESSYRTEGTSYDFSDSIYFLTGTEYCFKVVAIGAEGVGDSEQSAASGNIDGWFTKTDIQNVTLSEDGILSWDPYDGATRYWLRYDSAAMEPIGYSVDLFMLSAESGFETGEHHFSIVACDDNWQDLSFAYSGTYQYEKSYAVIFETGEARQVPPQRVKEGGKAKEPEDIPELDDFEFAFWMLDGEMYDFNTVLTGNVYLTPLYYVKAEAHAYPAEGGFVYTGEAFPPETGDPDISGKWTADFTGDSLAEFSAKANDGYVFKEWRRDKPTGFVVNGNTNNSLYVDSEENTRLYFNLSDSGYVVYAIFEKIGGENETAAPDVTAEPENTETPGITETPEITDAPEVTAEPATEATDDAEATGNAEDPTGDPSETEEPAPTKNPDGGGQNNNGKGLKAALIAVSVTAGVLLAGAAAVIAVLLIKRKK